MAGVMRTLLTRAFAAWIVRRHMPEWSHPRGGEYAMIVKDPISGSPVDTETAQYKADAWGKTYYFDSEIHRRRFLEGSRIAYFSMEIGLQSDIPTYSGGLGVLAGDAVRSSADLRIPLVAVTLVSRKGYLRQKITGDGVQQELPDEWDPAQYMRLLPSDGHRTHRWPGRPYPCLVP